VFSTAPLAFSRGREGTAARFYFPLPRMAVPRAGKAEKTRAFTTKTVRCPTEQCLPYVELAGIVQAACPISGPFVLLVESFSLILRGWFSVPGSLRARCEAGVASSVRYLPR
jgi:hypothetical protein